MRESWLYGRLHEYNLCENDNWHMLAVRVLFFIVGMPAKSLACVIPVLVLFKDASSGLFYIFLYLKVNAGADFACAPLCALGNMMRDVLLYIYVYAKQFFWSQARVEG